MILKRAGNSRYQGRKKPLKCETGEAQPTATVARLLKKLGIMEKSKLSRRKHEDLVEYIAKSIVNAPDSVVVTEEQDEQGIILKLKVADEDKGRVIGKQGRIAEAMRTLIRVKAGEERYQSHPRNSLTYRVGTIPVGKHVNHHYL